MSNDLQKTAIADGKAIEDAMREKKPRWNWTDLIKATELSPDSLNKARRGLPVFKSTINKIAHAIGVSYESLLKREKKSYKVVN